MGVDGLPVPFCRAFFGQLEVQSTDDGKSDKSYDEAAFHGVSAVGAGGVQLDLVLAADTVVSIDHTLLGKPRDRDNALSMLLRLAGRRHFVTTAVHILFAAHVSEFPDRTEPATCAFSETSAVLFHPFQKTVLQAYVDTGEPLDKAGAYAIQGQGAFLIDRIEGSWSTVVGLPVSRLASELLIRNIIEPADKG